MERFAASLNTASHGDNCLCEVHSNAVDRCGLSLAQANDVTECQQAEQFLNESQKQYRSLAEWSADGIFVNKGGRIVYTNPALLRMLGADSADQVLGKSPFEIIHPDCHAMVQERIRTIYASGSSAPFVEEKYIRFDGTVADVEVAAVPFEYEGAAAFHVTLRDITERKRAEQRLIVQHAVVSILAEATSLEEAIPRILQAVCEKTGWEVGDFWLVDREANVLTHLDLWCPPGEEFAEFREQSRRTTFAPGVGLAGRVWLRRRDVWTVDVTTDSNFPRAAAAALAGLRGGFGFPIHYGNVTLGVAEFFSRGSRQPDEELLRMFGNLGSQIGQFIERERTKHALHSAQQRLQYVVTSSPAVLFTLSVSQEQITGISWISENLRELLGYSPEATTDPTWWLENIHPDDRERAIAQTHAELFSKDRTAHDYRFRHQNGEYRWTRGEFRLMRDASGVAVEVVGSWSDITERKRLEEQFRQAQKMEAIGRLAGGMAHDFNNLLTVINGYGDIALGKLPKDHPACEPVREIKAAGERATSLTRQLLAFTRQQVIAPRLIDLNSLLQDAEKMLRRLIGEDIQLVRFSGSASARIMADPSQIEQVILNLAVNARDAMPRGGKLTIETRVVKAPTGSLGKSETPSGGRVLLSVSDTGCGMNEATKGRIFEPFFTTKGECGTGLGLPTVYGIVTQAGGTIEVESSLGVGTTFRIDFPKVAGTASEERSQLRSKSAPRGSETVLLVEDDVGVRILTRRMLESNGYKVLEAALPKEAIRVAEKHDGPIHLLIADVVLPHMGGPELAELLTVARPEMRVLFMSGYTDEQVTRYGVTCAEVAFLQKPYSQAILTQKVRELLGSPASHAAALNTQ